LVSSRCEPGDLTASTDLVVKINIFAEAIVAGLKGSERHVWGGSK